MRSPSPPRPLVRIFRLAATLALASCGSSDEPPHLTYDVGLPAADGHTDLVPAGDLYPSLADEGRADAGCLLGTTSNCSYCGEVCPPGSDTASTARLCTSGECDIECKEESYDVNGSTSDGCETTDDTPIHDTKTTAKDLGSYKDCDSLQTFTAYIPSDDRKHQKAPTDRPNGRDDFFKMTISDNFGCTVEAKVTVSFTSLPTGASYKVLAYYVCDSGQSTTSATGTAYGGSSVSLQPSTSCTFLGDDSGVLYVEVSKVSGSHSSKSYTLEIEP